MDFNSEKLDEAVMAMLYLNMFRDNAVMRSWKSFNWESMNRLFEKGYIADPKSKARSVVLTEEGRRVAEELFKRYFGIQ